MPSARRGKRIAEGHGSQTRNPVEPRFKLAKKSKLLRRSGVAVRRQIDAGSYHVLWFEAQGNALHFPEALEEQARSGQQHQRSRNLHGDQSVSNETAWRGRNTPANQ